MNMPQSRVNRPPVMDKESKLIYDKISDNAVLFLKRAIKELISHNENALGNEQAIVSCVFIQMVIELGLKAYLIRTSSVQTILQEKHKNQSIGDIYQAFECGGLKTKTFEQLKNLVIADGKLFDQTQIDQINKFQRYRNQAVHFNLRLEPSDLYDLKYELIYVLVHVIISILTELNMEFESPSEFFDKHLNKEDYKMLLSYRPYVQEMEKVAESHSRIVYGCIECGERTYSVDKEMCYCCNLQFADFGEYVTCVTCEKPNSVIFDHLNIASNDHMVNGLCLNCGERPQVYKCPSCEKATSFYEESELADSCYPTCSY